MLERFLFPANVIPLWRASAPGIASSSIGASDHAPLLVRDGAANSAAGGQSTQAAFDFEPRSLRRTKSRIHLLALY
jgi:hypothetical protein